MTKTGGTAMSVFERSELANGVRIVTAPMGHAQSTACYVTFAAGSRFETTEAHGLAHFVEHMLFCGTPRRPSVRELTGEVDAIGGLINAGTGKEYTQYYVKCASEYGKQALDVLADMVRNSLFEESEIEREKGVIVEELRGRLDTPRDLVDELYEELLYGDTTLGRLRLGREETIREVTRDQLVDFVGRFYEPSRTIVGLAGRVDDGLVEAVEELFGDLEPRPADGPGPIDLDGGTRVRLDSRPVDQAQLCLGVRAYPLAHPDRYTIQLLTTVLGGGMSSRLTEEVVMRRGLAYSMYAVNHSHTDVGSLWAQGGVNVDKIDDAIAAVVTELRRVAEKPVPAAELDKARNFTKGRFVFSIETPQGMLNYAVKREVLERTVPEPDEIVEALDAVTADDVQRVARDVLAGGMYLTLIGPYDDRERFEALIT
jgi:predicted Zn-dependent peptidase